MDAMGISKQFLFPTSVGLWATLLIMQNKYDPELMEEIQGDRIGKAKKWVEIYNDWMIKLAAKNKRIRPVAPLIADTVPELVASAKRLIDSGIRAVWLPVGNLPGGKSVAHPDLDPFWKLLSDSKCTLMLHIGTEGKFFESEDHKEWSNAPAFKGYRAFAEFRADPWYFAMLHVPAHNFISTMIYGGVFERFTDLRVGVCELAAYWVGPTLETLDLWYENTAAIGEHPSRLAKKPSYYFKRHFRVSPFVFEKIDEYMERYGLEDVLCYASDYPHVEGGKNTMETFYKRIERLGPEVVEKFFVKNAEYLFPD
jgi:predicted TIM-barrel fold metal-dependent hydrolase